MGTVVSHDVTFVQMFSGHCFIIQYCIYIILYKLYSKNVDFPNVFK